MQFGSRFCEIMNQVVEEFGPEPAEKSVEEKKRPGENSTKNPRPAKKSRGDGPKPAITKLDEMPKTASLLDITLSNVRNNNSVTLQVLPGSPNKELWLINKGNTEAKLTAGFILAGFGKGEYKQQSPATDREILFDMSPLPWVLHQSSLRAVEDVVNGERLKKPGAKVAYHDLVDSPTPEKPGAWKLTRKLEISFVPEAVTVKPGQTQDQAKQSECAALFPSATWNQTHSEVVFSVGWQATGLMPIRPQVVIKHALAIPPQCALKL